MKIIRSLIFILVLAALQFQSAHANELPAAAWYAVIWNQTTDTLHWVNSVTEQASIPRPKLPNENSALGVHLHISPNGRVLVIQGWNLNGNASIGFYDLQNASFIKTHEGQPGEVLSLTQQDPFTLDSQFVALALQNGNSWRVVAFNAVTGDPIAQLAAGDPIIPANVVPAGWAPQIALYDVDEGLGQYRVHIRFTPVGPIQGQIEAPSLAWIPQLNMISAQNTIPPLADFFNILPTDRRILYSVRDPQTPETSHIYSGYVGNYDNAVAMFNQPSALANQPKWLYNGQFVGFRVAQQPFATMWHLMSSGGSESLPFGPDFDYLYGTADGFILVDLDAGIVKYSNTFQFEAFTPSVGNTIYTTNSPQFQAFSVVYVTPMGASFELGSVGDPNEDNGIGANAADDVQANVPSCPGAPTPRLTIGATGRVSFTNGQPLNIRQSPAGERVGQLPEGTTFTVLQGPTCADGYFWYQVQADAQNGWAAEGDAEGYFIEPFAITTVSPVPPVIAANPTATLPLRAPTGDGDCSLAVEAKLHVGGSARTVQDSGELSLRTNFDDPTPSHLVPVGVSLQVIGGPVCHGGHRLWKVSLVLNGQNVTGYLSEGVQGRRYLDVPARAQ
ncbi:MAG: SH3 domain-containing protein [Anaerolineae bacterium]|nr:SH3 domain-containing protein [Anaerolineae bacterium]